jgi:Zn-dependent peptidase ImmA (M78 family)
MSSFGEAIITARRARGLRQDQLAATIGVTQAALSRYENDMRDPSPEELANLAAALGVTISFLRKAGSLRGALAVDAHMRRRATAEATTWRQLEAKLNMYRMHARQLFEEVTIRAEQRVPTFDPLDTEPADAARFVRMQWRMPIGPVRSLIAWLEAAGCLVLVEDFGTSRVDGLSQWVDDHPVILLNARAPVDRRTLTGAHELGHLALHSADATLSMEDEANAFASEFLLPAEVIRPQLRNLTLGRLHDLKREWRVSMQALIERAHHLGVLSGAKRTSLYKAISARGWRIREPVSDELPPDEPSLAARIGEALAARGLTPDEIAHIAGFAADEQNILFRPVQPRLRVVARAGSAPA